MHERLAVLLAAGAIAAAGIARAAGPLAPLPPGVAALSTHGPYEMGACETCHVRRNPRSPGPAKNSRDVCVECHEDFRGNAPVRMDKTLHPSPPSPGANCTTCHNPHNSTKKKLQL
jgi:predicted CXXCH cytochrome family protein